MVRRIGLVLALLLAAIACLQVVGEPVGMAPSARPTASKTAAATELLAGSPAEGDLTAEHQVGGSTDAVISAAPILAHTAAGRLPSAELLFRYLGALLALITGSLLVLGARRRQREARLPALHAQAVLGALSLRAPPALATSR